MGEILYNKPAPGVSLNWGHQFANRLIAAWLFNEGAGSKVNDYSGNQFHGSLGPVLVGSKSDIEWVGSRTGRTLYFAGDTSAISIPHRQRLNLVDGDSTIFLRYRSPSGWRSNDGFLGKWEDGNNFLLWTHVSSNRLSFNRNGQNVIITDAALYDGNTINVFCVTRGRDIELYAVHPTVGVFAAIGGFDQEWIDNGNDGPLLIGTYGPSANIFVNAEIDFMYVLSGAMTIPEMFRLYRDPYAMFRPSAKAHLFDTYVPYPLLSGLGGGIGDSIRGGIG